MAELTRRQLLAASGTGALGIAVGGGAGSALGEDRAGQDGSGSSNEPLPSHGAHQAGIATPAQDRLVFGAFDLTLTSASELEELLRTWTVAAQAMTAGHTTGPLPGAPDAPPPATGEAVGLPPSRLTITFGLGPSVFEQHGADRFGLASKRPAALTPIGPLPGEQLEAQRS